LWVCAALIYLLYAATLPTLFNTKVLYVPVAVAIGQWSYRRRDAKRFAAARAAAPAAVSAPVLVPLVSPSGPRTG
jgi:hypothetical protein